MKFAAVLIACFIVVVSAEQYQWRKQHKCGKNQVFTFCGSTCPKTCKNKDEQNKICTLNCKIGCVCKDGYVLNGKKCIRPEQCPEDSILPKPKKCGKNEYWTHCGTTCPRTCEHVIKGQSDRDRVCTQDCMSGCFCNAGYVRNGRQCVRESQCMRKTF